MPKTRKNIKRGKRRGRRGGSDKAGKAPPREVTIGSSPQIYVPDAYIDEVADMIDQLPGVPVAVRVDQEWDEDILRRRIAAMIGGKKKSKSRKIKGGGGWEFQCPIGSSGRDESDAEPDEWPPIPCPFKSLTIEELTKRLNKCKVNLKKTLTWIREKKAADEEMIEIFKKTRGGKKTRKRGGVNSDSSDTEALSERNSSSISSGISDSSDYGNESTKDDFLFEHFSNRDPPDKVLRRKRRTRRAKRKRKKEEKEKEEKEKDSKKKSRKASH